MYPAQEEAVFELLLGNHVIVNTPTGSGKSLVATAAHFAALASGRRSYYTAPIKALVSEKFFALCRDFGSDNVGMITGDAAVNADAPIICCTAEILANQALRDGRRTDVDLVVVDEFHYYGDPQRGLGMAIAAARTSRRPVRADVGHARRRRVLPARSRGPHRAARCRSCARRSDPCRCTSSTARRRCITVSSSFSSRAARRSTSCTSRRRTQPTPRRATSHSTR